MTARGAAQRYRQALALDSTNLTAWHNLASAYWKLGDRARWTDAFRGALRQVESALAVNPNDPV
ncbi:MAG: tetratricopeptide repeat protein, partial [Armatimonadetes bacterium]|nr:tetratricopeptide repeat protein [Armatimonadota bacterium]